VQFVVTTSTISKPVAIAQYATGSVTQVVDSDASIVESSRATGTFVSMVAVDNNSFLRNQVVQHRMPILMTQQMTERLTELTMQEKSAIMRWRDVLELSCPVTKNPQVMIDHYQGGMRVTPHRLLERVGAVLVWI